MAVLEVLVERVEDVTCEAVEGFRILPSGALPGIFDELGRSLAVGVDEDGTPLLFAEESLDGAQLSSDVFDPFDIPTAPDVIGFIGLGETIQVAVIDSEEIPHTLSVTNVDNVQDAPGVAQNRVILNGFGIVSISSN